jgi:DNA-binding NarL/FixJ family response regulator
MIESILQSCKNGLDVLTIYLLFIGFSQKEISRELQTTESTISRRINRIRKDLIL